MDQIKSLLSKLTADEKQSLIEQIQQDQNAKRGKITEMSSEVVDSNPYSRLMALKRLVFIFNSMNIFIGK